MTRRKSLFAEANDGAAGVGADTAGADHSARDRGKRGPLEERVEGFADTTRRLQSTTQLIRPEQCRMWRRHNRRYDLLTVEDCSDLIERIASKGQILPAIVRRLPEAEGEIEYEVIAGARRHFAVSYLRRERGRDDILYKVDVRKLTDEEAFELSDLENRDRKDVSEYERATDYETALGEFYEGNQTRMAEKIKLSRSTLINYLMLARVPNEILAAYGDPRKISIRHGKEINAALNDPARSVRLMERAAELAEAQRQGLMIGNAYPYDAARVFKELRQSFDEVGRKSSSRAAVRALDLGARGKGTAKVSRQKLLLEIPTRKGENVEDLLERIRTAFQ